MDFKCKLKEPGDCIHYKCKCKEGDCHPLGIVYVYVSVKNKEIAITWVISVTARNQEIAIIWVIGVTARNQEITITWI